MPYIGTEQYKASHVKGESLHGVYSSTSQHIRQVDNCSIWLTLSLKVPQGKQKQNTSTARDLNRQKERHLEEIGHI